MYKVKSPNIYASEIAEFLGAELLGKDFVVNHPSSPKNFRDSSFFYLDDADVFPEISPRGFRGVLILTSKKVDNLTEDISIILVENPRLQFIRIVNEFYIEHMPIEISQSAKIDKNSQIGRSVLIGENSVIGPDVSIGNNTKILNNVVITGRVNIGQNCLIKNNSTIGSEGYDFETDEEGELVHFPHIGRILIGNNVWIGANTTIENSAIDDTVIENNVKIDDLVQIGANCVIHTGSMITAGAILSRQVNIEKDCLIGPNVSIRDFMKIGRNVTVGIGSVVINNLEEDAVYVGNPARLLKRK